MPCADPINAFRPATGGPLKFKEPRDGRAYNPIQVPCGTCILCREDQARQWATRLTHEAQFWDESSFVTLSYAPENEPPHGGLQYEDLQKFWKRLRKNYGSMRYYAVGEYGDKTNRPHYHAAIFGHAFTENRRIVRQKPTALWTNPILEKAWGLGHVSVGALNYQTASYTASYMMKKLVSKQKYVWTDEETGELIELEQPKAMMSRNIAKSWFMKYGHAVYHHDHVIIGGRPQKPPKAYDEWMKKSDPDFIVATNGDTWKAPKINEQKMEKIKEERKTKAIKQTDLERRAHARNAHARAKRKIKTV